MLDVAKSIVLWSRSKYYGLWSFQGLFESKIVGFVGSLPPDVRVAGAQMSK